MIRIIDNKKIDLTNDEWDLYQKIVKSYTSITNKGEDFFQNLFETDKDGIITFLKPPNTRQTSFEIFLYLMAIQQQQHIRCMYKTVDDVCQQMKDKLKELK